MPIQAQTPDKMALLLLYVYVDIDAYCKCSETELSIGDYNALHTGLKMAVDTNISSGLWRDPTDEIIPVAEIDIDMFTISPCIASGFILFKI